VNTEEDVQFKDGNTGVFWNFGEFDNVPQDPSLFKLPRSDCSAPCSPTALGKHGAKHLTSLYKVFEYKSGEKSMKP